MRILQRRPANPVDVWDHGRYRRAFATAGGLLLVEVENRGTIDRPEVRFAIRSGAPNAVTSRDLARTLHRMLGLNVDPRPFEALAAAEPTLRPTLRALRGMRPPRFAGLFEAFASVVPFQQLSLEAGIAIVTRLVERFGEALDFAGQRFHAFPSAESIAAARLPALRACGLSTQKAQTLRHVARAIVSGHVDEETIARLPTDEALEVLRDLPGIGPWSASLILLRGLGRLDVFPPGDAGATRGLNALLQLKSEGSLYRVVERFASLRGCLYFYALGANLVSKGLIHSAPQLLQPE